ncbi:MAG: hypothetical protein JXB47_15290 [Anaerolineae bacterium]|nr:hypothetical protein [Anaerolineae bacterium]
MSFKRATALFVIASLILGTLPLTAVADAGLQSGAKWTFMVYMAADNDLEAAGLWDFDEIEWVGSTADVNIVAQIDRSEIPYEYERDGQQWGDWTEARRFFVRQDRTPFFTGNDPVENLGEVNMGSADTLADFLIWSITNYPAERYALVLWDHGSGWPGVAYDESAGGDGLAITEITQAFDQMRAATGVQALDLIAFDACLMAQIEVFNAIAPYGKVGVGSPELVPGNGYDYEGVLSALTANPNMDAQALGREIVDQFMYFYRNYDTNNPAFMLAAVDLTKVEGVAQALSALARAVQVNPGAVLSQIGDARVNALIYTEYYLDSYDVELTAAVDLGDLMRLLARGTNVTEVAEAARGVVAAVDAMVIHKDQSQSLAASSGMSIYFPRSPEAFEDQSEAYAAGIGGDERWVGFLRAFYGTATEVIGEPPQLFITDLFSQDVSVYEHTSISMDITGRDIATVSFVINYQLESGEYVTLDIDNIVTWEDIDGELTAVNNWEDGLNQLNFSWDGETPYISDGATEAYALLVPKGGVAVADGRFARAGGDTWVNATLVFDLDSREVTTVYGLSNVAGAPPFELDPSPGDRFQLFWSVLDASGATRNEPGEVLVFGEAPFFFDYTPAPDGAYRMGFVVEDIVGNKAYQWTDLQVKNQGLDFSLRGYTDFDWGFNFLYPESWLSPSWNSEDQVLYGGPEEDVLFTIYPLEDAHSAEGAAAAMQAKWELEIVNQHAATAGDGVPVQVVEYRYEGSKGARRGIYLAFYQPNVDLGFALDLDAAVDYWDLAAAGLETMRGTLKLFDPTTGVALASTGGDWQTDVNQALAFTLPAPQTWLPPQPSNDWLMYMPADGDGNTFVALRADASEGKAKEQIVAEWVDGLTQFDGYLDVQVAGQREYYIGDKVWAAVDFTYVWEDDGMPITGAFFVATHEGWDYVYWLEAPTADYQQTFDRVFRVMIDGFAFLPGVQPSPGAVAALSGALTEIYTAAGDSFRPGDLATTATFAADDDINVVFTTGQAAEIQAVFITPDGERVELSPASYEAGVTELDGLDWETYGKAWPAGQWSVEVYVNGELFQTLSFAVTESAAPAATGPLAEIYTAAGDGMRASELTPTAVFTVDDDINLVAVAGAEAVEVSALFTLPDGRTSEQTMSLAAGESGVLGLDWESVGEPWPSGAGTVAVSANGQVVQTVAFIIGEAEAAGPGAAPVIDASTTSAGGSLFSEVYSAAGDGSAPEELTPTVVFRPDDDINLVLVAAQPVDVGALFVLPDGRSSEQTANLAAGQSIVLGLDWESVGEPWLPGAGRIEVYVGGRLAQTVNYTVGEPSAGDAGASGDASALKDAYMASGVGSTPDQLTPAQTFTTDDNINIVIISARAATFGASFAAPTGERVDFEPVDMAADNWRMFWLDRQAYGQPWPRGDWVAEVYVNGVLVRTIPFNVR